jgi:hypothetical protein
MNAASEAKTRAVIIGVSRYPSGISQLPAVESDVREMKKILESEASAFGGNEVSVLTEETASCGEIIDTLQRILSGAEPSQSTFVYLAGHGTIGSDNEYYYVPFDADPKNISETCVPLKRIKEFFESSPSERLFLWLDFCHRRFPVPRNISVNRATGITIYLENDGRLEHAQQMAGHESPRTTKLYDRTKDEITLSEVERIRL